MTGPGLGWPGIIRLGLVQTALGAIVKVHTSLQTTGGSLVLASVGDGIRRVLAMTRLDRVFTLAANVDAAVSS